MPTGLTFVIHPDSQVASVDLFHRALGDINRLLLDANYAIRRERSARHWIVSGLHSSSPTITIDSLLGDQEAIAAIGDGIKVITEGTDIPPSFFTEQELDDLKRMRKLFRGRDRARSITVSVNDDEVAEIRDDISEKVDMIFTSGFSNLGSLMGSLEAINLHRTPTFTIWERVSGAPVRCSFPNESFWKERVRGLLENTVTVRGRISYFANGIPRRVGDVTELVEASPTAGLARAEFGSIPDRDAARDPVGFLKVVRGVDKE